jgi:hypothetical protein
MDDSDALKLEHDKKVTFFDCQQKFLPLNHPFTSDRGSFLKGKTIRKGPPKRKLEADITKMLDDLKEIENGEFKGYGEKHNWTHKSCVWELPYAKAASIINMCLDVTGFIKDKINARKDLATLCDHPLLEAKTNAKENLSRPHAPYFLKSIERKDILK